MRIHRSPHGGCSWPKETIFEYLTREWKGFEDDCLAIREHVGGQKPGTAGGPQGRDIKYGELLMACYRLGQGLRTKVGLKGDDVVGVFGANSIDWMIVVLSIQFAGLKSSLANPMYNPAEIKHVFDVTQPTVVFCDEAHYEKLRSCGFQPDQLLLIASRSAQGAGKRAMEDIMVSEEEARRIKPYKVKELDETAYYSFSSGTTGPPKAVKVSHTNVVSMLESLHTIPDLFQHKQWSNVNFMPMFHAAALIGSLSMMSSRGTIHFLTPFDPMKWASIIEQEKVQIAGLVPPVLALLNTIPQLKKEQFKTLKWISCGTSPLDAALEERFSKKLGVTIKQGYGMTETTVALAYGSGTLKPGSVGKIVPNIEARLVNPETGKDAEEQDADGGTTGELWVRGPSIVKGYYKNEKATRETIDQDGWLKTGDIVTIDKDGDLFIIDRMKELIKVKGFQVAPAELEGILRSHPKVRLAGVVGLWKEDEHTEVPRAYVDLVQPAKGDTSELERELQEFVDKQVSGTKRLRGGVRVIEAVPASPSGKILRRELKELQKKEGRQAKL